MYKVVILVQTVCDLQLVHQPHEDGGVEIRLWNALPADVAESRRDVLFDRRQQLCGGEIDVEFAVEEFRVAFRSV